MYEHMDGDSSVIPVYYDKTEILVTHTSWNSRKITTLHWQRVEFSYNNVNVLYSYKSDDLSCSIIVENICKSIDMYGENWKDNLKDSE
jgi:hypothetical protein